MTTKKKTKPASRAGDDHALGRAKGPSSDQSLGRARKTASRAGSKPAAKRPSKATKELRDQSDPDVAPSGEAAAVETPAPSQAVPKDPFEGVIYTTGDWKGLPNYECRFCGFATVNHQTALEHAAEFHAPPETEFVNTGLVDKDGAPITRAVQPAKED